MIAEGFGSPRVTICLTTPHVIYYIYQANGLSLYPKQGVSEMRKTQYYDVALKAAEAVPVITKKCAGIDGVEYDIEEYSTPDSYDDPFPQAATWWPAWFAYGKSWKTLKGAQRFLALQLQCHGKSLVDYARQFRIVARKSEA